MAALDAAGQWELFAFQHRSAYLSSAEIARLGRWDGLLRALEGRRLDAFKLARYGTGIGMWAVQCASARDDSDNSDGSDDSEDSDDSPPTRVTRMTP
jgi:hypothetical protein